MRDRLGSCAATTSVCAVAAALCAMHACDVIDARAAVSPSVVAATVALHVANRALGGMASMGVLRLVPVVPERRWGVAVRA